VRSTNSGLSCPDWPTCYGHWVLTPGEYALLPDTGYAYGQIMLEWTHRLIAGVLLGPLVLLLAVLTFRRRGERPALAVAGGVLILLLLVQGLLGGVTVLDRNSPWSVALHLGNALLVLSTILFILVRSGETRPSVSRLAWPAAVAWLLSVAAMTSAAMVAKSGAALACSTWPLCDGSFDDPLVHLHFTHRLFALLTAIALVALAWLARPTPARRWAFAAAHLVLLQVLLGGALILLQVPTWSAVLHQATGVLTFVLTTLALWTCLPLGVHSAAAGARLGGPHGLAVRGT
jgi:cytochrome c oxidase assembly protein subunit 15